LEVLLCTWIQLWNEAGVHMFSPILTGWVTQYDRMMRSYARLIDVHRTSHAYEDDLYHFFQDCWHLKDWIENDVALGKLKVETKLLTFPEMRVVRDLAIACKHLTCASTKTGAYVTATDVTVGIGGDPRGAPTYTYWVTLDDGMQLIAQEIAHEVIGTWDRILLDLKLLKAA
jgi:hypothetical protein